LLLSDDGQFIHRMSSPKHHGRFSPRAVAVVGAGRLKFAGLIFFVYFYKKDDGQLIRVISARDMSAKERIVYE